MPVAYKELFNGTGKGNINFDPKNLSISATKVFRIDYGDAGAFVSEFRYTQHPIFLGAYALTFAFEPDGKPTGENAWEYWKVTVGYQNLPYDPTDFKEVTYSSTAEIASIDKNAVKWDGETDPAKNPVNESPQVVVATISVTITLHNQPDFSSQGAADALKGKINDAAFSPESGVSYDADTVLYLGYDATTKFMTAGAPSHEISHKFVVAPRDWRFRFDPQTGNWVKVVPKVAGGKEIYEEGDFSSLGIP